MTILSINRIIILRKKKCNFVPMQKFIVNLELHGSCDTLTLSTFYNMKHDLLEFTH